MAISLGVSSYGTGAFGYGLGGSLSAREGCPREDCSVGDLAAGAEHLVEDGGGVDGDVGA